MDPKDEAQQTLNETMNWFTQQAKIKKDAAVVCSDADEQKRLRKQAGIYENLADSIAGACQEMGSFRQSIEKERFSARVLSDRENQNYEEYAKLMIAARKWGLGDDPYVREWFINRHGFGNRTYLRKPRRGWEKGIVQPLPLYNPHFRAIMRYREKGLSWRSIYSLLMRDKLIKPQSWSAFQQWLTCQNIQALFPKGETFQKPI